MDKNKDQKKNNQIDLAQFKRLIGDAEQSDFSLDDILAEYGADPKPPAAGKKPGKVVAFPGAASLPNHPPESEKDTSPGEDDELPDMEEIFGGGALEEEDEEDEDPSARTRVISFPEPDPKSPLTKFIKDVGRKADDYADRMFEEDEKLDPEEVRRLEKLIPGTDREEAPEEPPRPRRERKPEPPPPDLPPRELARTCARGLKWLRIRISLVFLLFCAALAQLLCPALGFIWLPPLDAPLVQGWTAVGLLGAGALLACDALWTGLYRAFRFKVGMDTLAALACLFTLADGVLLARSPAPDRLPYSAAVLAQLLFLLRGAWHKRCAIRLSCRAAAASSTPYRVTLDEKKWSGKDTYCKWPGTAEGFGSQIQTDDGAQRVFARFCPLMLLGDLLTALLVCGGSLDPERLVWTLSALFTASTALGAPLIYGRSFHEAARRLFQSGGALAGWPGIAGSRRGNRVLLTDADLFPPGCVELRSNYRITQDFPPERVLAYTATMIRDAGSGAAKPFLDELRRIGGLPRRAERLTFHEGGGLSAAIRGDRVLVGTASFMKLMDIPVSQGLNVRGAVFCAINGTLAGIFALNYILPDTVFPALEELLREKVGPVLATRDFNIIPAMLHQRFKLAADRMDFPPVERRRELSDQEAPHNPTLGALLCREGLLPFAEAVTAARRLRRATLLGSAVCCAGSALGLALCAYLTALSAYTSLSPLNLLIYLLTWLAPICFLTSWVPRY